MALADKGGGTPVARPEGNTDLVYRHPERGVRRGARCVVGNDDWGVFTWEERPVGTPAPGAAALTPESVPFLSQLAVQGAFSDTFMTDLFFVLQTPFELAFGGPLGELAGPLTATRKTVRCHGAAALVEGQVSGLVNEIGQLCDALLAAGRASSRPRPGGCTRRRRSATASRRRSALGRGPRGRRERRGIRVRRWAETSSGSGCTRRWTAARSRRLGEPSKRGPTPGT